MFHRLGLANVPMPPIPTSGPAAVPLTIMKQTIASIEDKYPFFARALGVMVYYNNRIYFGAGQCTRQQC